MRVRDDLHMKFKADKNDPVNQNNYKNEKKRVKQLLSEKKKSYFRNEFLKCKGDIKGTWGIVKKIIPDNKKSNSPYIDQDINDQDKANEFNEYFSNIGKKTFEKSKGYVQNVDLSNNDQPLALARNRKKFRPQPVDLDTLILVIKDLKPTNSCGSDGIQ